MQPARARAHFLDMVFCSILSSETLQNKLEFNGVQSMAVPVDCMLALCMTLICCRRLAGCRDLGARHDISTPPPDPKSKKGELGEASGGVLY